MNFTKKLFVFTIANAVVFYLVNFFFPKVLVFGNIIIPFWQAILSAAFGLTLIHILFEPIAEEFKMTYHKDNWVTVYLAVNALGIYLLARSPISNSLGIGIAAFWVAIVLGVTATIAQYLAWRWVMHDK